MDESLQLPPPNPALGTVVKGKFTVVALQALKDIEGISFKNLEKLRQAGIKSLNSLIEKAADRESRLRLSAQTGISEEKILKWVKQANMYHIKGVGPKFADLLQEIGIDTPAKLAKRSLRSLYLKLQNLNKGRKKVRKLPGEKQVQQWQDEAREIRSNIKY